MQASEHAAVKDAAAQVVTWRENIAKLERDVERARFLGERARAARDQVVLAARVTEDQSAKRKIAKARIKLQTATLEGEELGVALAQAREKLIEVEAVAREAEREGSWCEISRLTRQRLGLAEKIDEQLEALAVSVKSSLELFKAVHKITVGLGVRINADYAAQSLFGAILWRLEGCFPHNLPPPQQEDRKPLSEKQSAAFSGWLRDDDGVSKDDASEPNAKGAAEAPSSKRRAQK